MQAASTLGLFRTPRAASRRARNDTLRSNSMSAVTSCDARNSSDSASVRSVCTYMWDCSKNTNVLVQNTNESSFNDEFCDAFEKSLLDYVRTKDISDIDNEIWSIHKQTVEGIGCLPRHGFMRKIANCFTCNTSQPSRSISRRSSYSKPF